MRKVVYLKLVQILKCFLFTISAKEWEDLLEIDLDKTQGTLILVMPWTPIICRGTLEIYKVEVSLFNASLAFCGPDLN
jgi:hypothetical protein